MRLRYQLLLISLFLLTLPWGAWQYLKAVDIALKQSQSQLLIESAQFIADRLALQPQLFGDHFINHDNTFLPLYAYPLAGFPIIDGYGDEWRNIRAEIYSFQSVADSFSAKLQLAAYQQQFYFYLTVVDRHLDYYNPLEGRSLLEDHIRLQVFNKSQQGKNYFLRASAPGNISAHYFDDDGQVHQEGLLKGFWRETSEGYQVEFSIDASLLVNGFSIAVVDKQQTQNREIKLGDQPLHVVTMSPNLQEFLRTFRYPSMTLKVLNRQQRLVALSHESESSLVKRTLPWIIEWLYRQVLASDYLPIRHRNHYQSYSAYKEIERSLVDGSALEWYRRASRQFRSQTVASVAIPVRNHQQVLGYVLVEKTTDQLIALTTSAFNQLFIYTIGAFIVVALALLFYASWLSLRVTRLSRAANNVVNEKGRIILDDNSWPDLQRHDELGNLSRGYRQLLLRVQEYNDYLRTLSSKLSHELRTPIAVISSSLENMQQVDTKELKTKYYQRTQQGILRLSGILNAMSAASRIEECLTDAEFEKINLNDLLVSIVAAYNDAYAEHSIVLRSEITEEKALIAQELFVQMMDKLVDNATDFSPPSEPIIVIAKRTPSALLIEVENSGALLPEQMQGRLFESMISVRNSDKNNATTHLGLGLYIVRLIVELHQGDVVANNKEDKRGVVFSISLPLDDGNS